MAEITAKMVADLRKSTGSPMMDCKKALAESNGDFDEAVKILREKGMAKAAKRIGNETNHGRIFCRISEDNKTASMLKLTCETEPVRATQEFISFGEKMSAIAFSGDFAKFESEEINTELTELRAKLGENITIIEYERFEGDVVSYYIHSNLKVGVLIKLSLSDKAKASSNSVIELAKNLTLQIASLSPKSVSSDDLDPEFVKGELEIIKAQLKEDPKNANKPDNILEKIVEGRKGKIFAESCLLEQEYVKEKMFVKELIASVEKQEGVQIKVDKFVRFQIGAQQ
ncbi:MAG TPA: translation elongation factor Ts [Clostridiales bacterium]|jgi:elongation factor Ts|nr:translation elongation factor Ts [Clostridiales bacterium]HQP69458.1 translation elongation factor Ts [Clostridiales bacterium]